MVIYFYHTDFFKVCYSFDNYTSGFAPATSQRNLYVF